MARKYYDIIGDIHGHADALEALLQKLGYKISADSSGNPFYAHPRGRLALFIGDLVDRGPRPEAVLKIVYAMWRQKTAVALMGNHEDNLLAMLTRKDEEVFDIIPGQSNYLRPHTSHNISNTQPTWSLFHSPAFDGKLYFDWMMRLPIFFESPYFRAVHACWDQPYVDYLSNHLEKLRIADGYGCVMNPAFFQRAWKYLSSEYLSIETLLKGKEAALPGDEKLRGSDGILRKYFRLKWWLSKNQIEAQASLKDIAFVYGEEPSFTQKKGWKGRLEYRYGCETGYRSKKPLFFGHYWFTGEPRVISKKLACVDYSMGSGGKLAAYRWNGENELHTSNFLWVD